MDSTNNTAAYWVAGIIVVLAIILGAWLLAGGNAGGVGIPNTGSQQTPTTDTSGTNSGTGY